MTDRALNDRLRQKSRRAGLAIGLSMILTIALCLGAAAFIYAALMPVLQDVVPIAAPRAAPAAINPAPISQTVDQQSAPVNPNAGAAAQPQDAILGATEPTPTPEPEPEPTPTPAPTREAFEPTHQVNALQSVNLRSGPNGQIIRAIPIAAPLRYLDESGNGSDGQSWMRFETEDGDEGWLRADLVSPFRP
jgi:hypothetical protein